MVTYQNVRKFFKDSRFFWSGSTKMSEKSPSTKISESEYQNLRKIQNGPKYQNVRKMSPKVPKCQRNTFWYFGTRYFLFWVKNLSLITFGHMRRHWRWKKIFGEMSWYESLSESAKGKIKKLVSKRKTDCDMRRENFEVLWSQSRKMVFKVKLISRSLIGSRDNPV